MSYILDALKKAESERKLGSVPNVYMDPLPIAKFDEPGAAWRRPWVWILAVVVLAAGIAAAWIKLSPQETRDAAAPEIAAHQLSAPAPAVEPVPQVVAEVKRPVQANTPAATTQEARPVPETKAAASKAKPVVAAKPIPESAKGTPTARSAQLEPQKKAQAKLPSTASTSTSASASASTSTSSTASNAASTSNTAPSMASNGSSAPQAAEVQIAALRELPEHLQRSIPPLSVGGYIYSANPAERSILLNNRLVREGEQITSGLTLEKMMPKEAVLNYQGQRFRLSY